MASTVVARRAGGVNEALRRKCEVVRRLLETANADEVLTRHEIGVIILEVRDAGDTYGTGAVAELASALGRDAATLYRYAYVASRWNRAGLERLIARANGNRTSLSWSHLVELATVSDDLAREKLTEEIVSEGLSVRGLAARIRSLTTSNDDDADVRGAGALRRLLSATEALKRRAAWEDVDLVSNANDEVLALVEQTLESQRELAEICARNVKRLTDTRLSVSKALARCGGGKTPAPASSRNVMVLPRLLAGYSS